MNAVPIVQAVRCVIYTRYSTDEQNVLSTEQQIAECEKKAKAEGWTIVEPPFVDEALSGYAVGNRPAYLRLEALAEKGAFDTLLVVDTYRVARSSDLDPIVRLFQFHRVRIIGVQDGFDSESLTANMQAQFSGMTSAQTLSMVSRRTHAALELIMHKGGNPGGRAYGL